MSNKGKPIYEMRKKFCLYYVQNGGIAQDAARQAGYSESFIRKLSWRLLQRDDVKLEIARLRQRVEARTERNAIDVVNQIAKHAFAEILDYVKPDPEKPGNYISKSPEELTPDQRAAVASFKVMPVYERDNNGDIVTPRVVKGYEYKYTLHDQPASLIQMGRHFGIFDDKLKITNGAGNRFVNLTPEKLAELRTQIVNYMRNAAGDQATLEGEFSESPPKMLSDDRGSARPKRNSVGG